MKPMEMIHDKMVAKVIKFLVSGVVDYLPSDYTDAYKYSNFITSLGKFIHYQMMMIIKFI